VKYDQQAAQLFEVFIRAIDEPEAFSKVVKSLLEFCFQRLIASGRSSPTRSTTAVPTNLLRSNPFKFIVLGILRLRKSFVCIKSPRIVRGDFNYYVVPGKTLAWACSVTGCLCTGGIPSAIGARNLGSTGHECLPWQMIAAFKQFDELTCRLSFVFSN